MLKRVLTLTAAVALAAASLMAQAAKAPTFDVATIRPAAQITPDLIIAGKVHVGMKSDATRVDIGYFSLKDLIPLAYGVKPHQVVGPDWLNTQRFDISATLPEGATKEQIPAMLQALLAERFHLKVHRESKDQNIYALVVSKGGHKMTEAPAEPETAAPAPKADMVVGVGDNQVSVNRTANGAVMRDGNNTTKVSVGSSPGMIKMEMSRLTMPKLAEQITPMLDRPVVDMTELKGAYQVALELSMMDMMAVARAAGANIPGAAPMGAAGGGPAGAGPAAADPTGGSIFSSVQQLGLRLDGRKAPTETIVVDSVDKNPTEN